MNLLKGGVRGAGESENYSRKRPLVSIITVVKNGGPDLKRTIKSTLSQDYSNIEYIVLDGGSTDSTIDIIKEFDDDINIWMSERDDGIYDAMNKGIKLCNGSIIGFINSGDWYFPDTISRVVNEFLSSYQPQVVFGEVAIRDNKLNELYVASTDKRRFNDGWLPHPSVFISRKVYDAFGLFNQRLHISADYDFMLRINGRTRNKQIKRPLVNMIVGGISVNRNLLKAKEDFYVRSKNGIPFLKNLTLTIIGIISPVLNDAVTTLGHLKGFRFESIRFSPMSASGYHQNSSK